MSIYLNKDSYKRKSWLEEQNINWTMNWIIMFKKNQRSNGRIETYLDKRSRVDNWLQKRKMIISP